MAVSKQQKVEILNNMVEKFKNAKSIGFAWTTTLTVEEFSTLRTNLRGVWTTYTLGKKTLIKKALKDALNLEIDLSTLPGQIWALCSNEDTMSGLTKLNDFIKKNDKKIQWASCIIDWEIKNLEDTKVIAAMPSRETLLGRLVWSLQAPLSSLARFFDAASKDIEAKGKTTVSELKWAEVKVPEVKVEVEVVKEEKAAEEVKVEEVIEETKTEEV